MKPERFRLPVAFLFVLLLVSPAAAQKSRYLEEIKKSAEKGWKENPEILERWKKTSKPSALWGYDAPAHPVYLASTLAFLYEETGDRRYAERAAGLLAAFGDLRDVLPKGYSSTRAEYADGVPPLSNFFFLPPYVRAYLRIRDSGAMTPADKVKIEKEIAESVDFIFHFPEWGAHNRAMLRAEALLYASRAIPGHPHAKEWRQMAEVIATDNLKHWEIEDASGYHPVWLHALFSYADASGRTDALTSPMMRYYLEYYVKLIGPNGTVPDFGDASWNSASGGLRFVAILEKGAALYHDPEMKWAARSILGTIRSRTEILGVGDAYHLSDAYRWMDDGLEPVRPSSLSQEVLDEIIGKKMVFRNGWDSTSTYLLLNYRDEGDGGWLDREYLRHTISVEEEKMHHGHSDENSIVLLMNKGSVLLHDAGYRSALPSGRYGAWRQDYFHNRLVARKNKRDTSQTILEFVQNSGAYRPVRTHKVDFLTLQDVDMGRTREVDENLGYQWDRVIVYLREPGCFIVIDGVKILRSDYFTFTNFWHAQNVLKKGSHWYDVVTDSVQGFAFARTQSLLVAFPETKSKADGSEPISRHGQRENAIYQTISSQYRTGDTECFVTLLVPHDRTVDPEELPGLFRLIPTSAPDKAVAVEMRDGSRTRTVIVRLDLDMEIARENIRPRYLYDLGRVTAGAFESDAHFLAATVDGKSLHWAASSFLKVRYKGKTLKEALPNTHGLQLDGNPDRVGFSKWRRWEDALVEP
jgi:hypothetical protein